MPLYPLSHPSTHSSHTFYPFGTFKKTSIGFVKGLIGGSLIGSLLGVLLGITLAIIFAADVWEMVMQTTQLTILLVASLTSITGALTGIIQSKARYLNGDIIKLAKNAYAHGLAAGQYSDSKYKRLSQPQFQKYKRPTATIALAQREITH